MNLKTLVVTQEVLWGEAIHVQQEKAPPPIWNIVTSGQKGKYIKVGGGGPGIITHLVDEASANTFTISPC